MGNPLLRLSEVLFNLDNMMKTVSSMKHFRSSRGQTASSANEDNRSIKKKVHRSGKRKSLIISKTVSQGWVDEHYKS